LEILKIQHVGGRHLEKSKNLMMAIDADDGVLRLATLL